MYNNKPKTNVTITPATVAKLADIENIVAVKDSTGDMTNAAEYIRLTRGKDFSVLMGRDTLIYAALCYGATGAIASCANVAPRIAADIYDKYVAGDLEGARKHSLHWLRSVLHAVWEHSRQQSRKVSFRKEFR